jgi:hypothetical protein
MTSDATGGRDRRGRALVAGGVLLLTLAGWFWILRLPLTGADAWPILAQAQRALADPSILFTQRYLEGFWEGALFWRPGLVLFAGLEWLAFGESAFGFHLVRLLLTAAAGLLVARAAALRPGASRTGALVAAALYLLHPVQVETVPVMARDADVLGVLTTLGAVLLLATAREAPGRGRLVAGIFLALLAPTVKEPGLMAPVLGVIVLEPWRWRTAGSVRAFVGAGVLGVGLLAHVAMRLWLLGTLGGYQAVVTYLTPSEAGRLLLASYFDHQGWGLWPLALLLAGGGLALSGFAGTDPAPASAPWRRVRLAAWAWVAATVLAVVTAERFASRYGELLAAPLAVLIGGGFAGLLAAARQAQTSRARRLGGAGAGVLAAALLVAAGPGTPLVWRYPQWATAGVTAEAVLGGIETIVEQTEATGAPVAGRVGRFALHGTPGPGDAGPALMIDPFPVKPREPDGPLAGRVSTVLIIGRPSVEGFAALRGWPPLATVIQGGTALDVALDDLAPLEISSPAPPDRP